MKKITLLYDKNTVILRNIEIPVFRHPWSWSESVRYTKLNYGRLKELGDSSILCFIPYLLFDLKCLHHTLSLNSVNIVISIKVYRIDKLLFTYALIVCKTLWIKTLEVLTDTCAEAPAIVAPLLTPLVLWLSTRAPVSRFFRSCLPAPSAIEHAFFSTWIIFKFSSINGSFTNNTLPDEWLSGADFQTSVRWPAFNKERLLTTKHQYLWQFSRNFMANLYTLNCDCSLPNAKKRGVEVCPMESFVFSIQVKQLYQLIFFRFWRHIMPCSVRIFIHAYR